FQELGLVIVDEEHDPSFKQQDPAPRYQGRDAAVYLAHLFGAKALLGTATPSLESYHNAKRSKYGLVEMPERFGGVQMPEIQVVDAREELLLRKLKVHFTSTLLEAIGQALEQGEQVILFRNRRGYAPILKCAVCGWQAGCKDCDVNLTYHKFQNRLQCHYCGHQEGVPATCPACGSGEVRLLGFGTEKIEDELKIYFPEANIQRMDFDAVRSRNAYVRIINDFEEKRIDILVGTQMVTKGLDFENVGLVGVMSADQILQFPHFRSGERGFQLMTQVAGRAGRKHRRGKVLIQAFRVDHPVLREVLEGDYRSFFQREIQERQAFQYPPFRRLIQLTLKHKDPQVLNQAMKLVAERLKAGLGGRVLGPGIPPVGRVRGQYLLELLLKLEPRTPVLRKAKSLLLESLQEMHQTPGFGTVRAIVDVDPN
ncbi:MAG: primosomal protein N', partial [Bacteroidetes bacterium]